MMLNELPPISAQTFTLFRDIAKIHNVHLPMLLSICYTESKLDMTAHNPRDGGSASYGVCQVKLATARSMGFYGTPEQLSLPQVNVFYAAAYVAYLDTRYHMNKHKVASAYNAGQYTVQNKAYVSKVMYRMKEGFRWGN